MATVEVSSANQEQLISEGLSILYFTADWCPPCQQLRPLYEEMSEAFPEISFGKVDVDANRDLAARYGIRSIPTLVAHRDGEPVLRSTGGMSHPELRGFIEAFKG